MKKTIRLNFVLLSAVFLLSVRGWADASLSGSISYDDTNAFPHGMIRLYDSSTMGLAAELEPMLYTANTFVFTNVPAGSFKIRFEPDDMSNPAREAQWYDSVPSMGMASVVSITNGGVYSSIDFMMTNQPVAVTSVLAMGVSSISNDVAEGAVPSSESLSIWNSGGGELMFSVSAMDTGLVQVAPLGGICGTNVVVLDVSYPSTVAALTAGVHETSLSFMYGESWAEVPVVLNVEESPYQLAVSTTSISRAFLDGQLMPTEVLQVWNGASDQAMRWAVDGPSWMHVEPSGGVCVEIPQSVNAWYNAFDMVVGTNSGVISFSSISGGTTESIPIEVVINDPQAYLFISPGTRDVEIVAGSTNMATAYCEVWNYIQGQTNMQYSFSDDAAWLDIYPSTGSSTGQYVQHEIRMTNLSALSVGMYTARVEVTSGDAPNVPQVMKVELNVVADPPAIGVSTSSISVSVSQGDDASSETLLIWNDQVGADDLVYTVDPSANWLSLSATNGVSDGATNTLNISFSTAALAPGSYMGGVVIESTNALVARETVRVELLVNASPEVIDYSPTWFDKSVLIGSATNVFFEIWNAGTGAMGYAVSTTNSWISVSPGSDVSNGESNAHVLTLSATNLLEGEYTGTVSVISVGAANTPQQLPVLFDVRGDLEHRPYSIYRTGYAEGTATSETLRIWNAASTNDVAYTLHRESTWLQLSSTNGSSAGATNEVTVSFVLSGLPAGVYRDWIRVIPNDGVTPQQSLNVVLTITDELGSYNDVVLFDSKANGTRDIWMLRNGETSAVCLIEREGIQEGALVSPDGDKLAYLDNASGKTMLMVRDLQTGDEVSYYPISSYCWSADGLSLYGVHSSLGINGILRQDLAGGSELLFADRGELDLYGVSESGKEIVFAWRPAAGSRNSAIYSYNNSAERRTVLQPVDGNYDGAGRLSGDDVALCYEASLSGTKLPYRVKVYDTLLDRVRVLSGASGSASDYDPSFSPDGSNVLFAAEDTNGLTRLMRVAVATTNLTELYRAQDVSLRNPVQDRMFVAVPQIPSIALSRPGITNSVIINTTNLFTETFDIWNAGNSTLNYRFANTAHWCWVSSSLSGTSTGEVDTITVSFYVTNLTAGTYQDVITISGDGTNAPVEFPVQTTIEPPLQVLSATPDAISCMVTIDSLTSERFLNVQNTGGRTLLYSVQSDSPWMSASPTFGTTTGEVDEITIDFDGAGVGVTTTTGLLSVVMSGGVTQAVPVTFEVSNPRTNPPVLFMSTNAIRVTAHELRDVSNQTFEVSNVGGSEMEYWFTYAGIDWFDMNRPASEGRPYSSRGYMREHILRVHSGTLPYGVHKGTITVHTATAGSTNIVVTADIKQRERFPINLTYNPLSGGWVTRSTNATAIPFRDQVTLTAHPFPGYRLGSWSGDVEGVDTQVVLTVVKTNNITVNFNAWTRMRGQVTNTATGRALTNVVVSWGAYTTRTDRLGWYYLDDVQPGANQFECEYKGYRFWGRRIHLFPHVTKVEHVGLAPDYLWRCPTCVTAVQRPGTRIVDIEYELKLTTNDIIDIAMEVSADGGRTWDIPCDSVRGDVGGRVRCGDYRQIVWDAGADYPNQQNPDMKIRIIAPSVGDETSMLNRSFALDTRAEEDWRLRCWIDKNSDDTFQEGEQVATAEVYAGGRTTNEFVGWTDPMGFIEIPHSSYEGLQLFARKLIDVQYRHKRSIPDFGDSNVGLLVWMDSDVGGEQESNWNGEWQTYELTESNQEQTLNGTSVYLQMAHPLFEWSLYAGCLVDDDSRRHEFEIAFEQASRYLYDITDGQMKLGEVNLCMGTPPNQLTWTQADLRINAKTRYRANAIINGRKMSRKPMRMGQMHYEGSPTNGHWAKTLIHEWGHYGFGFWDEYLDGWNGNDRWDRWRADHPGTYPANIGFMEHQQSISEMSSWNDYWISYTNRHNPMEITKQVYVHSLLNSASFQPCWADLARYFEGNYDIYPVTFIEPPYGWYEAGAATSQDRAGPTRIPAPYTEIDFTAITAMLVRARSAGGLVPSTAEVVVIDDGMPLRGAMVQRESNGRIYQYGKTSDDGRIGVNGSYRGDVITARCKGQQVSDRYTPGQTVELSFGGLSTRTIYYPQVNGLVVRAELDASTNATVEIISKQPLQSLPEVVWYPDVGSVATVSVTQVDARRYTCNADLVDTSVNIFQVACVDTQAVVFIGQVGLQVSESTDASYWSSSDGSTELFFNEVAATQFIGQISQCDAPVILPDGFVQTNQMSPCIDVAVTSPGLLSSTNTASMIYYCDEDDLMHIDATTLEMYRWNNAVTNWVACSAGVDRVQGSVSVLITNAGTFVVLGDSSADVTPPAAVTDLLAVTGSQPGFVDLSWTATGDDGTNGTAYTYHLYYATSSALLTNGAPLVLAKEPAVSGSTETYSLKVDQHVAYVFMLKVADEAGNVSGASNEDDALAAILDANENGLPDDWEDTFNIGLSTPMAVGDDVDGDGLTTAEEYALNTDPRNGDTDGDGMSDKWETEHGLDPLSATDGDSDNDLDTIKNSAEYGYGTNPDAADTDGDTMRDDWEIEMSLDPVSTSNDDGADVDPDGDLMKNGDEYVADTKPLDSNSVFVVMQVEQDVVETEFSFWSSSRRAYQVQRMTNLVNGSWNALGRSFTGTGTNVTRVVTNDVGATFYRIQVTNP